MTRAADNRARVPPHIVGVRSTSPDTAGQGLESEPGLTERTAGRQTHSLPSARMLASFGDRAKIGGRTEFVQMR